MAETLHRGYQVPVDTQNLDEVIWELALITLPKIDLDIHSLLVALGGKASIEHGHAIEDIEGLQTAINALMPADRTFTLAGLPDVEGLAEAPDGYVLVKQGGMMVAMAAAAAIGEHQHGMSAILGLDEAMEEIGEAIATKMDADRLWTGSQADYDALPTKRSSTVYIIV